MRLTRLSALLCSRLWSILISPAFAALSALAYSTDWETSVSGPLGELNLAVDLKNTAILGNAKQQAKALQSYLAQFDQAQARGSAKADLRKHCPVCPPP